MAEEGEIESTTSIKKNLEEHKYYKDPVYKSEIQNIMKSYCKFRECIRDGNCLYTSYAIALADLLALEGDVLLDKLVDVFKEINSGFGQHKIDELGYMGFYETFVNILADAAKGSQNLEDIPLYSWYDCVAYLRLVVSCEIRSNPDKYQPHITEMDVSKYCTVYVDPFYKEAGYVEICALSNSIPIKICVVDLNRSKHNIDAYGDHPIALSIFYTHNHFEPIYEADQERELEMGSKSKHGIKTKKMLNLKGKRREVEERKEEPTNEDPRMSEDFLLNHTLRPPYNVILDTNFINDCIRKKYDAEEQLMKIVNGSIRMCIPECVIGELEKLGRVFRVALAFIKGNNIQRLECDHKGTYADDCIFNRVSAHRCYIVATSDTALRQRIKTLPGVPLITYRGQKCFIERFVPATF